ncbi:MAG: sugar phosphate isomerase/epimerase [Acidobacteriaceae bacterium]|nr:sugar phosphate isomerase/epimerase [Acidobacteriaceae bacterium]
MTNPNRRQFLQLSTFAVAGAAAPRLWCRTRPTAVGVQLYTVQKEVMTDLPGTLAAIRKIGYTMVESFSGMHARPANELKAMVQDAGLTLPSAHFSYNTLETQVQYAHDLGVSHMVCAMLPKPMQNREGFMKAASGLNKAGALAKAANIRLSFHNHNFEFQPLPPATGDGAPGPQDTGLRILLDNTNQQLVSWEEDCYWVAQGGQDPLTLLKQHQHRISMLHLKDRLPGATTTYTPGKASQFFTEIGTGTIDWEPIMKIADSTGKLIFVEQDTTTMPALDSLALSYKNLLKYIV